MKFDGLLQRAKDRGIQMLMIQLNPKPRIYSTMPDKEMTKSLGTAVALVAKRFSENSGGKHSPEAVMEKLLVDLGVHAHSVLPTLKEGSEEAMLMRQMAHSMTAKLKKSPEFADLFEEDDDVHNPESNVTKFPSK